MKTKSKIHVICRALSTSDGGHIYPADWRLEYELPSGAKCSYKIGYKGQSPMGADLIAALGAVAEDITVADWSAIPVFNIDGARLNKSSEGVDCGMQWSAKCVAEWKEERESR